MMLLDQPNRHLQNFPLTTQHTFFLAGHILNKASLFQSKIFEIISCISTTMEQN